MTVLLNNAGRAFLKVFLASLLIVLIGIGSQPTLHGAGGIAVAGVMSSIAAGLVAIQTFVPQVSFAHWIADPYGKLVDSFTHGFLAALITSLIGILAEPSLNEWRALLAAAVLGASTAGLRAVQGALTPGETPYSTHGFTPPQVPPRR